MNGAMRGSPWEDDRKVQFLRDNWGKISASQIGLAIGIARNGVISKAHRLGLDNLGSPIGQGGASHREIRRSAREAYQRRNADGSLKVGERPRPVGRPKKIAEPEAAPVLKAAGFVPAVAAPPVLYVLPTPRREKLSPVEASDGAVPITALKPGQCKFAVTPHQVTAEEHRFCGQPAEPERPYCAEHRRTCKGATWEPSTDTVLNAAPKTHMPDFAAHVHVNGGHAGCRRR